MRKWITIIFICLLIGFVAGKCSRESDRVDWFENHSEIPEK